MFGITLPAVLLRFLPHILIVAVAIGTMLWLDHRGYQRAVLDQQRAEARARVHIAEELSKIDGALGAKIDRIRILHRTINNTIQKEIVHEARYSDPGCYLTAPVLQSVNAARAGPLVGGITVALPEAIPAD